MASLRQQIEDAVAVALRARLIYLRACEPYNGEIDQSRGPDDLRRLLVGRSPAVLLSAGGASFKPKSIQKRRYTRLVSLECYLVSCHSRTREDRVRSDVVALGDQTSDPGIYQIAEDVVSILAGEDLGLAGVGPFMPSREDVLIQESDFTAWRLTLEVPTDALRPSIGFSTDILTDYEINGNLVDTDGETVLPDPPNPFVEADGDLV